MAETVHITLDQGDIEDMRENGCLIRQGVYISPSTNIADATRNAFRRTICLGESTLYRTGEAVWPRESIFDREFDVRVEVEYDRPDIDRFIESEVEFNLRQDEDRYFKHDEYYLGVITGMRNAAGWTDSDFDYEDFNRIERKVIDEPTDQE